MSHKRELEKANRAMRMLARLLPRKHAQSNRRLGHWIKRTQYWASRAMPGKLNFK